VLSAGIRSRCLCAQGDLVGAVAVGRKGLDPAQHDSLAAFLALQGGVAGAHLALMGLQGLSLAMEAELCIITGGAQGGRGREGRRRTDNLDSPYGVGVGVGEQMLRSTQL
jgi:hypothetical protein